MGNILDTLDDDPDKLYARDGVRYAVYDPDTEEFLYISNVSNNCWDTQEGYKQLRVPLERTFMLYGCQVAQVPSDITLAEVHFLSDLQSAIEGRNAQAVRWRMYADDSLDGDLDFTDTFRVGDRID